jgi:hypothetical protein
MCGGGNTCMEKWEQQLKDLYVENNFQPEFGKIESFIRQTRQDLLDTIFNRKRGVLKIIAYSFYEHAKKNDVHVDSWIDLFISQIISVLKNNLENKKKNNSHK